MRIQSKKKLVYIAMSGGVDSSVAAALLKKQGFDLVGVFMKPWSPNLSTDLLLPTCEVGYQQGRGNGGFCLWKEDREDAMRTASVLGIQFETWDFSKEYKKSVTDYMIREYKAGRTPNPDVMCNKEIKFGLFFDKAIKEGADYIATGHYVNVKRARANFYDRSAFPAKASLVLGLSKIQADKPVQSKNWSYSLYVSKDKNKDQSYFLWTLKQKQLERCLFPIGNLLKPEVRKLAKKFGLQNHDKKDSQGVCFIGSLNMKDFLQTKIKTKKGDIRLLRSDLLGVSRSDLKNSSIIGTHDGVYYYTIGQRHGLGIDIGGGPYYVVSKDIKRNIIYVGKEKDLYSKNLKVSEISWIGDKLKLPAQLDVRLRYRAGLKKATLKKNGTLELKTPERAITSGQSAVFYKKGELLGGGIIE